MLRPCLRVIFLLVLALLCQAGHGQALVPGYIVTTEQDSLRGAICRHDELAQQVGVDFVPLNGTQRRWLDAHQVKAYGYVHRGDTVRYVAVVLNQGASHGEASCIFLRQLVAGPVELYEYRYTPLPAIGCLPESMVGHSLFPALSLRSARFGSGHALVLYQSTRNTTTEVTWWNFPTDAAAYFADYPALAADLQAKHYRRRGIPQVVKRYNAWCTAAAPLSSELKLPKSQAASTGPTPSLWNASRLARNPAERP